MNKVGLAKSISAVANAPVIATLTFVILVSLQPAKDVAVLAASIIFATVLPLLSLAYLSRRRVIPDFYASDRKSRLIPFIAAIACYACGVAVLLLLGAVPLIDALMLCYLVNTTTMMLITLRWKISIHSSGIAGPATVLAYALGAVGYVAFLFVIPIGWARVAVGEHTIGQVLAGALVTIALTYAQLVVYVTLL